METTITKRTGQITEAFENHWTARIERAIHQPGSLSVVDSTLDGKPTIEYGLTEAEAIDHVRTLIPGIRIVRENRFGNITYLND